MTPRLKKFLVPVGAIAIGFVMNSLLKEFATPHDPGLLGAELFLSFIYVFISIATAIVSYFWLKNIFLPKTQEPQDSIQTPAIDTGIVKSHWSLTYKISLALTVLYIFLQFVLRIFPLIDYNNPLYSILFNSFNLLSSFVFLALIVSYIFSFITAIRERKWLIVAVFCIILLGIILSAAYLLLVILPIFG